MIKMMPISHQQAYVLARNWYNWAWATQRNPWYVLPPMQQDNVTPTDTLTVSEFTLRNISIKGDIKTVDSTEALTAGLIDWARGNNSDTFYWDAMTRVSISSDTGLKEYYVKLSDNSEYISEPFWLFNCGDTPAIVGDYSNAAPDDDWNNDYWK